MMRFLLQMLTLSAIALVACAGASRAELEGTFEPIGPVPPPHSVEQVQLEEFLNFTCPHCNNFRTLSKPLLAKYGKRIRHVDVPILFRGQAEDPLRLYYVAAKAGRGDEVKELIFDATFRYGVNIYDPKTVGYIARSAGLAAQFEAEGNAAWVNAKIREAHQRADQVGVEATPTIVLNGTLRLVPRSNMQSFVENLDRLIAQLLKP
jgi:predicted DsbA family dithiol-disulfide isomerase